MALDDDIAILAQAPLFAHLERDALRLLAFAAQPRILMAGDILFRKDEPADGGYVVTAGSIALDARDDGSKAAHVARPGALIGEIALITDSTRPATAVAREHSSVMKITRDLMLRVLNEFPDSAVRLRGEFAARLQAMSADLARVSAALDRLDT